MKVSKTPPPAPAAAVGPGVAAAWALGVAGLIPFFVSGAALWGASRIGPAAYLAPIALLTYAATIVSFLGGVRWGVEIARDDQPDPRVLVAAVLPQIGAWACLFVPLATEVRFGGLLALIGVQGGVDMLSPHLPAWYRRLRLPLTVGAGAALISGLAWTFVLKRH